MRHLPTLLITSLLACGGTLPAFATTIKVADVAAFNTAVARLQAGDTLVLAAGQWRDAQLVFKGMGTEKQPIVLRAEQPGAAKMVGQSSLRLVGSYLVVSGLDFREGYAPKGGVIEYRDGAKGLANHCRVTECVIDNYNRPGEKDDKWVHFYGQYNRFDHNYVAGKKTVGVTMVVELPTPESRENHHRIDHNFFGPRPRLGSNGGETIRIGLSETSLTSSRTVVEENYFYRCSGEVEIVSVKSGENIVRRNLFEECEGSVVLRHGNNNLVEGNYFLGNGKEQTGGVRIINAGHKILHNYFADLRGTEFRGALVIMHGVPNSPLNRYAPVHDVAVENNTFVNCSNIELGAGKDAERTQAPADVTLTNNVFYGPKLPQPFHTFDNMSGLKFAHNLLQASGKGPDIAGVELAAMQTKTSADGLLVPVAKGAATPDIHRPVTAAEAGPRWFRPAATTEVRTGRVWPVATPDALLKALQAAKAHDIIELTQAGIYPVSQTIGVTMPLTVRAKKGLASRPVLAGSTAGQPVFRLENGGRLRLAGVALDGKQAGATGLVQAGAKPALEHHGLWADNCAFYNVPAGGNVFRATTETFADTVQFANCLFYDIAGTALSLATETQDKGTYNAEYVILRNCLFRNVQGSALDLYRGGNDESTLGPFLTVNHCTFDKVGDAQNPALMLTGVQWTDIRNSLFNNSATAGAAIKYKELGKSKNLLTHTNFSQSGKVEASYPPRTDKLTYVTTAFAAPQKFDYRLKTPNPQLTVSTDGRPVGFVGQ